MSGSPKYTTADLRAQARAAAVAAQRAREAARRAAEAAARKAHLQQRAAQLSRQLAGVIARLDLLGSDAQEANATAAVRTARTEADAAVRRLRATATENTVAAGERAAADLDARTTQLVRTVTEAVARKRRRDAVAAVRAQLAAAASRTVFDPTGAAEVDGLLARTDAAATDAAFGPAFGSLTSRVAAHLAAAAGHEAEFERVRAAAQQETDRLERLLAEASTAGVELSGAHPAQATAGRLRQVLGGGWPGPAAVASADGDARALDSACGALETELEEWMQRLDRAAAVADAVIAAAPLAGLRLVPNSFVRERGHLMFRTTRTDDASTLDVEVVADEGGKVSIGYHGSGTDFRTELTTDGQVKRCDLTEEILTRLHDELAAQGVDTNGLHWDGRPEDRTHTARHWTPQQPKEIKK